jgi:effector-binding domain-containing protein
MKKIRNAAIILLGIIILLVLVGYLLPRKIHVERAISVKSPVQVIFDQVNVLENWKQWSPWNKLDTAMKISYEGKSGKGASYSWQSSIKSVGSGTITITECKPGEFLALEMDFRDRGKASSYFRFETSSDSVRVSWGFDNDLGINPFMRYFGGMMKNMIGKSYIEGLTSLKTTSEKLYKESTGLNIHIGQVQSGKYIALSAKCKMSSFSNKISEMFQSIMDYIPTKKIQMSGLPIVIYHAYSKEDVEFETAVPFTGELKSEGKFKVISLPEGNAVIADYHGSYWNIEPAYDEIQKWIKINGKVVSGSNWEEYVTDPTVEKDTARWLTKIYFPVK